MIDEAKEKEEFEKWFTKDDPYPDDPKSPYLPAWNMRYEAGRKSYLACAEKKNEEIERLNKILYAIGRHFPFALIGVALLEKETKNEQGD